MSIDIVVALIGVIGALVADIILSFKKGSKILETIEIYKKELEEKIEACKSDIGVYKNDKPSLTGQHEEFESLINKKTNELSRQSSRQSENEMSVVTEINERAKKELYQKEEREKHLSPELLESKKVVESIQRLQVNVEELNESNVRLEQRCNKMQKELESLCSMSAEELLKHFNKEFPSKGKVQLGHVPHKSSGLRK